MTWKQVWESILELTPEQLQEDAVVYHEDTTYVFDVVDLITVNVDEPYLALRVEGAIIGF
jgi:hypothetical protein